MIQSLDPFSKSITLNKIELFCRCSIEFAIYYTGTVQAKNNTAVVEEEFASTVDFFNKKHSFRE